MANWKRAVVIGSLGAGALLLVSGRRAIGAALAALGALTLASEYPDEMRELWQQAPEFLDRGNRLVAAIARISERLAEQTEDRWRSVMEEGD